MRERARRLPLAAAAFTGGAAVLAVESAASLVLAPFVGNSLYVWGALIGVVLAGLAAGYWLGGALADRLPRPALMVGVLGLGGLAPVAVRLRARSMATLGRTAGRLFAVSTAGSIAGTFATAFWLVPELGVDQLFACAAAALLTAAALYALAERLP